MSADSDLYTEITIDNLSKNITPWDPNEESHLYAIVDMGSNGIRFSITSLAPPFTRLLRPIYAARAPISLFTALEDTPKGREFPEKTIKDVAKTLGRFHQLAVQHGVPQNHIIILATEATRSAANKGELLKAITDATKGLKVNILAPAVETLFGAVMGSRSGLVDVNGGALFLDLGGGSVQMTWVDTSNPNYGVDAAKAGVSLPYGAAKLTNTLKNESVEIQTQHISELQTLMKNAFENLCTAFPALKDKMSRHTPIDVFMCGGGFRGYGSMLMYNDPVKPYPIPSTNGYTAPGELFSKVEHMLKKNEQEKDRIFGLSKRRRDQFPAIAKVIEAFLKVVPNIGKVTFCGGSNRQGALMMKLPDDIRHSNPLHILAGVTPEERPVFDAVRELLKDAIPKDVDISTVPTVLTTGLDDLFIRDIWARQGYDADSNTSFALHDAITRDADAPGLAHVARALLALTTSARWGGNLGPLDLQLQQSLSQLLESQDNDAPFWAAYIGAVAGAIATVLPVLPRSASELKKAISIESCLEKGEKKKNTIKLTIEVASANKAGVSLDDIADKVEGAAKKNGGKKPNFKISAQVPE
ncbi:hypothetical protein FDECE_1705 [Fusarium decemcellulare]|nr:hypothetical protein FDECE_1705 [Fusarium decemcellulare]